MGNAYASLGLRSPDRVPVLCVRICDAAAPLRHFGVAKGLLGDALDQVVGLKGTVAALKGTVAELEVAVATRDAELS